MKSFSLFSLLLLLVPLASGQVISTDPALPIQDQPVTITFHADQGDQGLINYTGDDVYAHTGVITDKSSSPSDWKYVKAPWATNTAACKLTKISSNEYRLDITTSIRQFYNVPAGEKIQKMAFVFRNGAGTKTGRDVGGADIFADVYEQGLNVSFIQPPGLFSFVTEGQSLSVEIGATACDSLKLFLDEQLIRKIAGTSFDTALHVSGKSRHRLVAVALQDGSTAADTAWYMVPGTTADESLPAGLEDGINYPADDSAVLVLFAPDKDFIYVLGDFNTWLPDSTYQLKRDGDRFWIAIGNLLPGKEYAFQYLVDGQLKIADPYSEKILDPYNDKYIPEAVYPDLQPYPAGKTEGIAGVLQPGKPVYSWNDGEYAPPQQQKLIIYELLIRDFVTTHDIKDVAGKLDYLQTLGINAIELMPFSEFEGNSSWGYNPSFYFATDKYYGRDTDIKDFIQECHKRGIAVIMDIVLNHAYEQNSMVRLYFNSATGKPSPENPWFNENSPNTTYSWGYDFNHESAATQYFVDRVVEYWLKEFKVDGFRFDFTKGFTNTPGDGGGYDASRIAILKRIYSRIKAVNHDAFMICEHFAVNSEEKELSDAGLMLWGNINYNYNEATMGYLANSGFSWISYKARGWNNPYLVGYMESHDEERLMYKNITYGNAVDSYNIKDEHTALQRMQLAGAFFLTIPGPKMIWQFGELGYDISIDYNGRVGEKPVKWEYLEDPEREMVYLTWAKILDLRKKYPVFNTDDYTLTVGNNVAGKKIVLRHAEEDAVIMGNFGLSTLDVQAGFTRTGKWYEVFSGDSLNVTDVNVTITLNAGEYRIYTSKKMESVISGNQEVHKDQLFFYPNPVSEKLYISTGHPIDTFEVFNLAGTKVISVRNMNHGDVLDVSALTNGLYLLRVQAGEQVITGRFVKR
jgi:glycosidase